ncbi:acyl-CoA synthase [Roseobacter sp. SK209-2-6]|nr:acyl-CoA synthase [Roseobacter sp. SK209-2-6]
MLFLMGFVPSLRKVETQFRSLGALRHIPIPHRMRFPVQLFFALLGRAAPA